LVGAEEPDELDAEEEGVEEFEGLGEPDELGDAVVEELLLLSLLLLFDPPLPLGLVSGVSLPSFGDVEFFTSVFSPLSSGLAPGSLSLSE
jgi:hypothetical protein